MILVFPERGDHGKSALVCFCLGIHQQRENSAGLLHCSNSQASIAEGASAGRASKTQSPVRKMVQGAQLGVLIFPHGCEESLTQFLAGQLGISVHDVCRFCRCEV